MKILHNLDELFCFAFTSVGGIIRTRICWVALFSNSGGNVAITYRNQEIKNYFNDVKNHECTGQLILVVMSCTISGWLSHFYDLSWSKYWVRKCNALLSSVAQFFTFLLSILSSCLQRIKLRMAVERKYFSTKDYEKCFIYSFIYYYLQH